MRYKLLGKSGLRVSELSLGTMTFGEDWGWGSSRDESRRIFEAYVENGGNFFDTADGYTNGSSEKMLGEFVKGQRERAVIATKYTFNTRPGDPNGGGNHRKNMVQALEGSLKRLQTDYIDLYWVHAWDFLTPVEEVRRLGFSGVVGGSRHDDCRAAWLDTVCGTPDRVQFDRARAGTGTVADGRGVADRRNGLVAPGERPAHWQIQSGGWER